MTNKNISALTAATTPLAGTEVLPIVQSGATVKVASNDLTVKNLRSNATTGILQVAGPAIGTTRVATVPDANWTAARTDVGQTFAGDEVFSTSTAFTRANVSTAGIVIGDVSAGGSCMVRTPSVNGSFGSGFAVDGTYAAGLSTINFRAIGVNSGGAYTSKWSFWTTDQTNTTEQFTISADGTVTVKTGNLIQGTAAKGINFTANTPAAGMTSQLLNWYEEGTWTPTVTFGGASVGVTYGSGAAKYTRIGNLVTCTAYITLTSKGSSTGNVAIAGLPFTVAAGSNYSFGGIGTSAVLFSGNIFTLLYPGTTTAVIYQSTLLGVRSIVQDTAVSNTSEFSIQFSYQV